MGSIATRVWRWIDKSAASPGEGGAPQSTDLIQIIPFIAIHVACLAVIWVGWSWIAVLVAVAAYVLRMFAITAFYHRYFSHRAFKTSRTVQFAFAFLAGAAAQKGPLWWAAHHRHHHRHSDSPRDVHSPHQHGFWWSHFGWIASPGSSGTDLAAVPDLARYPELRLLDRFDVIAPAIFAFGLFILGTAFERFIPHLETNGWQLLVWGFFVSTVVLYHCTFTINSLCHVWGSRRYATRDDSRNNLLLAFMTLGEGWHNNHHRCPGAARQGFFWWEIDVSYYVLRVMAWMGIIWDLNPVPEHLLAPRSIRSSSGDNISAAKTES